MGMWGDGKVDLAVVLPSFLEKVLVDERPKVVIYDVSPYFFMLSAWMLSCRCRSFGASYPISYPRCLRTTNFPNYLPSASSRSPLQPVVSLSSSHSVIHD